MSFQGVVKSFDLSRGYGFITWEGRDFVFHKTALAGPPPNEGDTVIFDVGPSSAKPGTMVAKSVAGGTMGRHIGIVQNFGESGWGFIFSEGREYSCMLKDCEGSRPQAGDTVQFDLATVEGKPGTMKAVNVTGGTAPLIDGKGLEEKGEDRGRTSIGSGTFTGQWCNGKFGSIKQDGSEERLLVYPEHCIGFDGQFPQVGTRVTYKVVTDWRTGRLRAENVKHGKRKRDDQGDPRDPKHPIDAEKEWHQADEDGDGVAVDVMSNAKQFNVPPPPPAVDPRRVDRPAPRELPDQSLLVEQVKDVQHARLDRLVWWHIQILQLGPRTIFVFDFRLALLRLL